MNSDKQLLKAFAGKRDERAFRLLVDRHADWSYGIAVKWVGGNSHLAEEVCQSVFLRLAQNAGSLVERETIGGWLYVTLKYVAMNKLREETRRKKREEIYAMQLEKEEGPDVWQGDDQVLSDALDELKEVDRDAVCLRFFEGLSFRQIGQRLGVEENAARMRIKRALGSLQGLLAKRGVRTSSAALSGGLSAQISSAAPVGLAAAISEAAISSTLVGLSAPTLGASLVIMKTKIVTATAVAVALVAGGTAVYQWDDAQSLRTELELVLEGQQVSLERIQVLETKLEGALATGRSVAGVRSSEGDDPVVLESKAPVAVTKQLTRDFVLDEYRRAKDLLRSGNTSEAAKLLFWVLDDGISEVSSLEGYKGAIVESLGEIAQKHPSVHRELSFRRDAIQKAIVESPGSGLADYNDLRAWHKMNQSLGEESASLETLDSLENPGLEGALKRVMSDTLVREQRYEDAVWPGMGAQAMSRFEQMLQPPQGDMSEAQLKSVTDRKHELARASMGLALEALAGAGKNEEALSLIENVLERDSSDETLDTISQGLQRADRSWLLDQLESESGS